MTALEYGKENFDEYSLNHSLSNIYVFDDKYSSEDTNNEINESEDYLIEYYKSDFDNKLYVNEEGEQIPEYVFNYLKDTKIIPIQVLGVQSVIFRNKPYLVSTFIIENKLFASYKKIIVEEILVKGETKEVREKPKKNVFGNISELLKEKQLSIVLFISSDGALLERAYQQIDKVFKKEVVFFIERKEDKSDDNIFGTVARLKTGDDISSESYFPIKEVSQVVNIFKLDLDRSSLKEIFNRHLKDKGSMMYAVKKWFLGFDKVVSIPVDFALDQLHDLCTYLSEKLESWKIEDTSWKYYDENGKALQKTDLFLPGISLFENKESKNSLMDKSDYKKAIAGAVVLLTNIRKELKQIANKSETLERIFGIIIDVIDEFINFIKNPTDKFKELAKQHFILVNAFIVGVLNGILEAVKGIVDLIGLIIKLVQGLRGANKTIVEHPSSVIALFFEMLENTFDTCLNLFTKENLNAIVQFFKDAFLFMFQLPGLIYNWIQNTETPTITIDTFGYYLGYIMGIIIEIVAEILATGGAGTVAEALSKLGEQLIQVFNGAKKLAEKTAKKTFRALKLSGEQLLAFFRYLRDKSKDLPTFFKNLWNWINKLFQAAKAKIILSSGVVLHCEIIPIGTFANALKNILKARWLRELEGLGLVIAKQSDNVYSFVYKGVEIFKGTKAEAETALKEYFENSKKGGLEKYLDEILDTKKLDEVINSKNYEFLKLGLKYEHEFLKFKTGMKEISHYLIDASNKKILQGITTIDKDGVLFSAFDVTFDYRGKGVSKAMYELIGKYEYQFKKIHSTYTAKSMKDNYEAFMKVYDSRIDNKVEAVLSTPSGKTISKVFNNRYSPADIIIEEGKGINLYWVKK